MQGTRRVVEERERRILIRIAETLKEAKESKERVEREIVGITEEIEQYLRGSNKEIDGKKKEDTEKYKNLIAKRHNLRRVWVDRIADIEYLEEEAVLSGLTELWE